MEKMCLILFAYKYHPQYRLILLANRDDYYQRPSLPLDYWPDAPAILAGRDLQNNGTWLGITRTGRLAAVTNFRDPANFRSDAPSRGLLAKDYLTGTQSPRDYLEIISSKSANYNGFNLLVGDQHQIFYSSNYHLNIIKVNSGIHGLSNHLLNSAWPKVTTGKRRLKKLLDQSSSKVVPEALFTLLTDCTLPDDSQLPNTGIGLKWERILAPLFIIGSQYGTRCSSVILVKKSGQIQFNERTYSSNDPLSGNTFTRTFSVDPHSS
jgi:uncharacterized protein with NRDE domain